MKARLDRCSSNGIRGARVQRQRVSDSSHIIGHLVHLLLESNLRIETFICLPTYSTPALLNIAILFLIHGGLV